MCLMLLWIFFYYSIFFGLIISFSYAAGCTAIIVALQHKASISQTVQKLQKYLGLKQEPKVKPIDCDICNIIKCTRHLTAPDREPWRRLFITRELDDALAVVCVLHGNYLKLCIVNVKKPYCSEHSNNFIIKSQ